MGALRSIKAGVWPRRDAHDIDPRSDPVSVPSLHPDFSDLLTCFREEQVEFLIVGAFALAANGVVRATGDLDVWVRPDPDNARRVWRALARFGAPLGRDDLKVSDLASPGTVYQMGLPPMRIDVLTGIDGVAFDEAWASRIEEQIGALRLCFLGRRDLVRNKRATGRIKDQQDVELLREAGVPVDDDP